MTDFVLFFNEKGSDSAQNVKKSVKNVFFFYFFNFLLDFDAKKQCFTFMSIRIFSIKKNLLESVDLLIILFSATVKLQMNFDFFIF